MVFIVFFALAILHPELLDQAVSTNRCVSAIEKPDDRVTVAAVIPVGRPPVLLFRYFEDKKHNRFANLDVMLDDAGH